MGRLVWVAAGFLAAVLGAEYVLPVQGLPYMAAALAALCLPLLLLRGRRRESALLVLLSAAAGLLLWRGYYDRHVEPGLALDGEERAVVARVTGYPAEGDGYIRFAAKIKEGAPEERALFYLYSGTPSALTPGDIITATVKLSSAAERDGKRLHTYTAAGINLICTVRGDVTVTGRAKGAWMYFPLKLGETIKALCRELFPEDTAAFMQALLTGDKAALDADGALYDDMRAAGVLHIVAVSGMHISVLVGFIQFLLGHGRRVSLLSIPLMVILVMLTGGSASVVRAAVMQTLILFAPIVGRERDGPSSLSAAALLLLLINPMAAGGISFQLSFSCVLGFVVLEPGLTAWAEGHLPIKNPVQQFVVNSVTVSACAMVFSLPVAALWFGTVPLFSVAANLLTLVFVSFCFAGGYFVCAVGAAMPGVGRFLALAISFPVRWCMLVYRAIAKIPFACLYTENAGVWIWLAGVYAMAIILYILLRRRGFRMMEVIPAEIAIIGLCAVFLTGGLRVDNGGALTAVDVGQGQCVALTAEDATVLIDCGGSDSRGAGEIAADWLYANGRNRVDALILTHLHADHTNGVTALLDRIPVDRLLLPAGSEDEENMLPAILDAAGEHGTEVIYIAEELTAHVGSLNLTLMLPRAGAGENESGVVVLASFSGQKALVMGDAEENAELALLARGVVPDVDILVVGHHGSKTSSNVLFLRAARAETALISVGYNSYGHPGAEVLEHLAIYADNIYRTDEDGTVTIQMNTDGEIYG